MLKFEVVWSIFILNCYEGKRLNNQEKDIIEWLKNLDSEFCFWDEIAKTQPQTFDEQKYSIADFEPSVFTQTKEIRVLDLGCGPRGALKDKYDLPSNIKLYACDPLAFLYMDILKKYNLKPSRSIDFCLAELLSAFYPKNYFDYIIAQNALDHSINPQMAIQECLKVLKIGGVLYLKHEENEAEVQKYSGLRKWNFSLDSNNDFVISNQTSSINVNEIYVDFAKVESKRSYVDSKVLINTKIDKQKGVEFLAELDNREVFKLYLTSFMAAIQEKIQESALQK